MLAAIAERIAAPIAVDRSQDIPDDTREEPADLIPGQGRAADEDASATAPADPTPPASEGTAP